MEAGGRRSRPVLDGWGVHVAFVRSCAELQQRH
jgi:hypothetical protein